MAHGHGGDRAQLAAQPRRVERQRRPARATASSAATRGPRRRRARPARRRARARRRVRLVDGVDAAPTCASGSSASTMSWWPWGDHSTVGRSVTTSGSTIVAGRRGGARRARPRPSRAAAPSSPASGSAAELIITRASSALAPRLEAQHDRARGVVAADAAQPVGDLAAPLAVDDVTCSAPAPARARRSQLPLHQQLAQRRLDRLRGRALLAPDAPTVLRRPSRRRSDRAATRRPRRSSASASAGPCEPAGYCGSGPGASSQALTIGSQIRHCASTSSLRVNSVASPRIASSDQALVGLGRLRQERRAVEELHVHRADPHPRARDLRGERQRHALVRLHRQDQLVRAHAERALLAEGEVGHRLAASPRSR